MGQYEHFLVKIIVIHDIIMISIRNAFNIWHGTQTYCIHFASQIFKKKIFFMDWVKNVSANRAMEANGGAGP